MKNDEMSDQRKGIALKIRVAQAISAGIFTFGLSGMAGDVSVAMQLPVSAFSITTTLFGVAGVAVCEVFARKFE